MADGWLLTGVPAAGKSTVGRLLAERLRLPFVEGDAIHPGEHGPSEERYLQIAAALPGAVVEDVVLGTWLAWLVDSAQTPEETVAEILARTDEARV